MDLPEELLAIAQLVQIHRTTIDDDDDDDDRNSRHEQFLLMIWSRLMSLRDELLETKAATTRKKARRGKNK